MAGAGISLLDSGMSPAPQPLTQTPRAPLPIASCFYVAACPLLHASLLLALSLAGKQALPCIHSILGSPCSAPPAPSGCPGFNSSLLPGSAEVFSCLLCAAGAARKAHGISAGLCEAQRHPGWALCGTGRNSASSCFFLPCWKSAGKLLVLRLFLTRPGEDGAGFEWKRRCLGTLGPGSAPLRLASAPSLPHGDVTSWSL